MGDLHTAKPRYGPILFVIIGLQKVSRDIPVVG